MTKQPRVPGTRAEPEPNREQRRHPEKFEQPAGHEDPQHDSGEEPAAPDQAPDDMSVRAKSSGHGKKTADKWNQ